MARKIEVEIIGDSRSLERAFGRACDELTGHRAALDGVAAALLDHGSIDRDELQQIMVSSKAPAALQA